MATVSERLAKLMATGKYTYDELEKVTGIPRSSLQRYATGQTNKVPLAAVERIAAAFHMPAEDLAGWADESPTKGVKIPVLGFVPAGVPIEAIQEVLDHEEITPELAKTGEFFGLRVKGSSMSPRIQDGDTVIVKCQDDVESGQIAIVLVNSEDATCKKVIKHGDNIALMPLNPAYEPRFFGAEEVRRLPVRVIGRVIELRAKI